jgi:hypothetical protein
MSEREGWMKPQEAMWRCACGTLVLPNEAHFCAMLLRRQWEEHILGALNKIADRLDTIASLLVQRR